MTACSSSDFWKARFKLWPAQGQNHVSHQSSRFSPITDNVAISYEGNLRVAHCVGRRKWRI